MRILLLTAGRPWPINFGGALRTHALAKALASKHHVALAAPEPADEATKRAAEQGYGQFVSRFVWVDRPAAHPCQEQPDPGVAVRVLRNVADFATEWRPLQFRDAAQPWHAVLSQLVREFDAVLCRHAPLGAALPLDLRRVVFDLDDLMFLYCWRALGGVPGSLRKLRDMAEVGRTWLAEQIIGLRAAHVLVSSQEDARRLLCRHKSVIPNGVALTVGPRTPRRSDTVVFVGHCSWEPNRQGLRWFIKEVWPLVLASRPLAVLRIVGLNATAETLPFARADRIELIPNVPSVKPWFEAATVSVVPILFAAGTRIKILESLGYGTPVVATRVGAGGLTEAFDASTGLYVADGSAAMAAKLCELLTSPQSAAWSAARGADLVAARYTWDAVVRPLVENFDTWVAGFGKRA